MTALEALEHAGYAYPNNCRAGACGECKVHVRSGEFDQGFVLDMALTPEERQEGYGLMCMAKPISEVLEIDYATADALPKLFPPRFQVPFIVTDKLKRTPEILELHLRPVETPLRYWPGQYITLGSEEEGIPARPYSIANAPRQDGEITLFVKEEPEGTTSTWIHHHLAVGTRVLISGPYGTFVGDPAVEGPVLCLASSSGLAPILALADAALRRGFAYPVTLLFSARTEEDVYPRGLLAYWEAKYSNFHFIRTLTREPGPPPNGRIPNLLPQIFDNLVDHSLFIAGSPSFVRSCIEAAKQLGASDRLIYTEAYFPQADPVPPPIERLTSQA